MSQLHASLASDARATAAQQDHVLLRRTLIANFVFSLASGALLVLLSGPIAEFLGVAVPAVLLVVGVGLLAFALIVLQTARQVPLNRTLATAIFGADVAWVIGTAVILAADLFALTPNGKIALLVVALIVADLAFFEWLGLRRGQQGR